MRQINVTTKFQISINKNVIEVSILVSIYHFKKISRKMYFPGLKMQ